MNLKSKINEIARDIEIDLMDEFDRNFERKAFFDRKWKEVKTPAKYGSLMMREGNLRRSIASQTVDNEISFSSSSAYAKIHNEGGTITGTQNVRAHKKNLFGKGERNVKAHTRNVQTTIPQRQIIGQHSEVDKIVESHVHNGMDDFIRNFKLK